MACAMEVRLSSTPPKGRLFPSLLSLDLAAALSPADAAEWKTPPDLIGSWSSTPLVTVRLKNDRGDFLFVKETVPIRTVPHVAFELPAARETRA
jgi:hypothetical protein